MKYLIPFLFILGCGHAPLDPAVAGVCIVDPGLSEGRVWRPCEEPDQIRADGKSCQIHFLDRVEFFSPDDPAVMTCADCYDPYGVKGDCQ